MCLSLYPDADRFVTHQLTSEEHYTGERFVGSLSGSALSSTGGPQPSNADQAGANTENQSGPGGLQLSMLQWPQGGSPRQREGSEEREQRKEYEWMQREIYSDDLEWEGSGEDDEDEEDWLYWGGAHELYKSPCLHEGYTQYCCLCVCGWKCPLWLLFLDYVEEKGQGPLLCLRDGPRCRGIFCGPPCNRVIPVFKPGGCQLR